MGGSFCKDVQLASLMERMDEEFRALVQKVDRQMHDVVRRHPPLTLPPPRPPFEALVRIVAGQQLSVKAAATIMSRIEDELDGDISPQGVQKIGFHALRGAGLSGAKCQSVLCIAEFAGTDADHLQTVIDKPWDELRPILLSLQGIGPWSADMYAMLGLGMQDIFSSGDLGLRVAMETHLGVPQKQKPAVYDQRALCWRPYRTMASMHLWHSLKPDAVRFAE